MFSSSGYPSPGQSIRPSVAPVQPSETFKGIALFTPGGDLVYCIDSQKQARWHLQLCAVMQEVLGLPEPPHFLVPCYTATVDRWLDPKTQELKTFAEASPLVLRHQALLNVLFGTPISTWQPTPGIEEVCDKAVIDSYRTQFPQLWQDHDLVIRYEKSEPLLQDASSNGNPASAWSSLDSDPMTQGYVLRLFVAGHHSGTERILRNLHQLLEKALLQPYTLKVIDVSKHPDLAEADQVAATPTLLKVWPTPMKRIVGELEDPNAVLRLLSSLGAEEGAETPTQSFDR
jgi:circadian clock protein KaiB